jgi:hypothetical protein
MQHRRIDEQQCHWEQNANGFDTLSSDGLQIVPDYKKTIIARLAYGISGKYNFFPIYIVNETSSPKLFIAKDSYVFAIQEALDTSNFGNWYAIEVKGWDFCGNGYFRRKLMPDEYILFLMPKYQGSDTTFLRTRIKIGENIVLSPAYKGVINVNQFKLPKKNTMTDEIKKLKSGTYRSVFYGALNKQ